MLQVVSHLLFLKGCYAFFMHFVENIYNWQLRDSEILLTTTLFSIYHIRSSDQLNCYNFSYYFNNGFVKKHYF